MLRPGDVFIDGGANVGAVTEAAAKLVGPSGRVYAIEPDPRCHEALDTLAAAYRCIRVVRAALTATGTISPFYQARSASQSSLLPNAVRDLEGQLYVDGLKLDDVTYHPVRAVKLDLQGYEPHALAGASRLLVQCDHWCLELWPWGMQGTGAALVDRLESADLTPHWMDDGYPATTFDAVRAYVTNKHSESEHINMVFAR